MPFSTGSFFAESCSSLGAAHLPPHLRQYVQVHRSLAAHTVELLLLLLERLLCVLLPVPQLLLQLLKQQ